MTSEEARRAALEQIVSECIEEEDSEAAHLRAEVDAYTKRVQRLLDAGNRLYDATIAFVARNDEKTGTAFAEAWSDWRRAVAEGKGDG